MAENLAYYTSNGCWAYDNNQSNVEIYGYLYNWETAINVCPSGWHLPSDAEWTTLTDYLGGENVSGGKMKETGTLHWNSPNTGATNESGFLALPGGYRRNSSGSFSGAGYLGNWWSAAHSSGSSVWHRFLGYGSAEVHRFGYGKSDGFSVRCLRD